MDYMKIILDGISDENASKFLDKYFYREYKKAEVQNYDAEEFYNGLMSATDKLVADIDLQYYSYRKERNEHKGMAISGKLGYPDLKEGETIEMKVQETVKYVDGELNKITKFNYSVNLFQFTKDKYRGQLFLSKIHHIQHNIFRANRKLTEERLDFLSNYKAKDSISFVTTIEKDLREHGLEIFLNKEDINVLEIIRHIKTREHQFSICLLFELGFLDYLQKHYCEPHTKTALGKLIAGFFLIKDREATGNINKMSPMSKEHDRYTSINNLKEVREIINKSK
jgi:hypothetical protein